MAPSPKKWHYTAATNHATSKSFTNHTHVHGRRNVRNMGGAGCRSLRRDSSAQGQCNSAVFLGRKMPCDRSGPWPMSYLPLWHCHQHPPNCHCWPHSSTPNHVLTAPILATFFHQWARIGFGHGFQRIEMFHIHKTVCITVDTEVCYVQTNAVNENVTNAVNE